MGLIKKWLKMLFKGLSRERIPQDEEIEKPPLPFTAPDPGARKRFFTVHNFCNKNFFTFLFIQSYID